MSFFFVSVFFSFLLNYVNPLQLHGSGGTNPSRCFWSIMDDLQAQSSQPVYLTYRGVGSTMAAEEFVQHILNNQSHTTFGSSEIPMNAEDYRQINEPTPDEPNPKRFIHLPVLAGSVGFFHSVPDTQRLNLTACILSQIYNQEITSWGDSLIADLNPDLGDVAKVTSITVATRTQGAGSTDLITQYLHDACDNPDQRFPENLIGALPDWPEFEPPAHMVKCASGSSGMAMCIEETPGTIGYIDTGHGHAAGLEEVRLAINNNNVKDNKAVFRNSREASIEAAVTRDRLPLRADDDFSQVSFLNSPGANTWPLVQMTYIYVRTNLDSYMEDPRDQALFIAFLRALYRDQYISQCQDNYGFTLLTGIPEVKAFAVDAIHALETSMSSEAIPWRFETRAEQSPAGSGPYVFWAARNRISDYERDILLEDVSRHEKQLSAAFDRLEQNENQIQTLSEELTAARFAAQEATEVVARYHNMSAQFEELEERIGATAYSGKDEKLNMAAIVLSSLACFLWLLLVPLYVMVARKKDDK